MTVRDDARRLNDALTRFAMHDGPAPDDDRDALTAAVALFAGTDPDELGNDTRHELWMARSILAGKPAQEARLQGARVTLTGAAERGDVDQALERADELADLAEHDRPTWEQGLRTFRDVGRATRADVDQITRAVNGVIRQRRQQRKTAARTIDDDGRPVIVINDRPLRDLSDEARAAIEHANTPPAVFRRAGGLARVTSDHGRHFTEAMREAHLRGRLARVANTVIERDGGSRHVRAPDDLVRDLLVRDDWRLPALVAVIEAPALRPDGTVLHAPGYDQATRLYHAPAPGLTVPAIVDQPGDDEITAALDLLDQALGDFPYDGPGSRANALALLLTPIVRPAIDGPVPLCLLDAPQAGTGKSLLAHLTAIVATGRPAPMIPAPQREEEWQKALLAWLMEGPPLVVLDNVHGTVRSAALDLALTADAYAGRRLGATERIDVPQRATWIATGNNIKVAGDLARRTYRIRLDAKTSRPWQRDEFRHPDLRAWARQHRGDLLHALLTLARAWWAAGQPAPTDAPTIGGFDAWTTTLAGILQHAGIDGFLDGIDAHYDDLDEEAAEWERFLRAWHHEHRDEPTTAGTIAASVHAQDGPLRDALPGDLADALNAPPASFVRKLGKALSAHAERRHGDDGIHLVNAGKEPRGGRVLWRVVVPAGLQVPQVSLHRRLPRIGPTPPNRREENRGHHAATNLQNLPNLQDTEATP